MGDDPKESFAALFNETGPVRTKRVRVGERLEVTISVIGKESVFGDIGVKQEGVFARADLLDASGEVRVKVGSVVSAVVTQVEDEVVQLSPVFLRNQNAPGEVDMGGEVFSIPKSSGGPLLVEGAHVRGKVTGVERYGLFVQIDGTYGRGGRGLVPVSETSTPRGTDLKKLFPIGHEIEAKILAVDEDGKIRLSIKALEADAERKDFESFARDGGPADDASAKGDKKAKAKEPRGFGTLGDLLAKSKKKA